MSLPSTISSQDDVSLDSVITSLNNLDTLQITERGPMPILTLLEALDMKIPMLSNNPQHRADQLYKLWINLSTNIRKAMQTTLRRTGSKGDSPTNSINSFLENPSIAKINQNEFKAMRVESQSMTNSPIITATKSSDPIESLKLYHSKSGTTSPIRVQIKPPYTQSEDKRILSDDELKNCIKEYFSKSYEILDGRTVSSVVNYLIHSYKLISPYRITDKFLQNRIETIINDLVMNGSILLDNTGKKIKSYTMV